MGINLEPQRHLNLEGAYNIRDIGGYPTSDGRCTRWKTLLRTDSLHKLPPESQAFLIEYGVCTVIDLRRTIEVRERPNVFASSLYVRYYHQNMLGDVDLAELADASAEVRAALNHLESAEGSQKITLNYCTWLDLRREQIGETLATLAVPGTLPALYHCAGGKDRTGLISALVLGLAGVPAETIAEDYALTARYLLARNLNKTASAGVVPSDITWQDYAQQICPPDAMVGVLKHLEECYGGTEGYVLSAGLTPEQIDSLRHAVVE